ncbi:hypothetical protein JCM6882_009167, partial [Rhodosporidiobolus microsporus]
LFSSTFKGQDAPQPSTAFAAPTKAFDAGDILLPFDLEPSSSSLSAQDLLAFPVFDPAPISQPPPLSLSTDPLSLDAALESPLGLNGSASSTTSPLSEFLASPMFSLPGSALPSTTFSELPLPSPPADATPATTALPFFPPLPSTDLSSFAYSAPASTFLRPSPPLPTPPLPVPSPSPALPSTAKGKKRPTKPTGFAPTATPLLALDAPIQSRSSVLPSATSRKRKTAAAEKALAKRRKSDGSEDGTPAPAPELGAAAVEGDEDLPADIVAAVERKRLQNTLSARKSRARKQARLQELESENEALKARVEELERILAAAAGGV